MNADDSLVNCERVHDAFHLRLNVVDMSLCNAGILHKTNNYCFPDALLKHIESPTASCLLLSERFLCSEHVPGRESYNMRSVKGQPGYLHTSLVFICENSS